MEALLALIGIAGVAALLAPGAVLPSDADFKKASDKLTTNPDDPDANTVVGKYLAFVKGDYVGAMPYLQKSSDKVLRTLADHESDPTYTDTAVKKVGMGDEWVAATKDYKALNKIFYDRAAQYYATAFPDLQGPWKDKARAQGKKLAMARPPGAPRKAGAPSGWLTDTHPKSWTQPSSDGQIARNGSYSVRLVSADPKTPNSYVSLATDLVPISGKMADISAYVLSDGTESGQDHLEVRFYGNSGKEIGRQNIGFVPVDVPFWSRIGSTIPVPPDTSRIQLALVIVSKNPGAMVWVDDVSVKIDSKEALKNGGFETP